MSRRGQNRTLALLALVGLGLVGLVLWDRRTPTNDQAARARDRLAPSLERQSVNVVVLERGGTRVELRREGRAWWLVTPHRRADDGSVEALLSAVDFGDIVRHVGVVDAASLRKLGLQPPRVVVRTGGLTVRLGEELRGNNGDSHGVYAQRGSMPEVLLVEPRLLELAELPPAAWQSRHATVDDPGDAHTLAYGEWSVEKRANGWFLSRPFMLRASDAQVELLLSSLARARALGPAGGDGAAGVPLALDGRAQARVTRGCDGDGQRVTLVRADGARLCFAAAALDALQPTPDRLCERRPFPLRLDDIDSVEVVRGGERLALGRERFAWRVSASATAAGPASDAAVHAWLERLLGAQAPDCAAASVPEASPRWQVRMSGGAGSAEVSIGRARDGGLYARRAGDERALKLPASLAAELDAAPARFK